MRRVGPCDAVELRGARTADRARDRRLSNGAASTSARRAASASPRARPAPPRASPTRTAPAFCTRCAYCRPMCWAIKSTDACFRSCRCFTPMPGDCPLRYRPQARKLVLPGRHADGASLARLIAAEEVTIAVGVPTVWLGLCEHLEATGGPATLAQTDRRRWRADAARLDGADRETGWALRCKPAGE